MEIQQPQSILVVGSTGYLGMEVCRQLVSSGKNVSGLIRKTSAPEKVDALRQLGIKTVEGDLKDKASIKNALKGITTIISTASSTISHQEGDTIQTVDNEGQSTLVREAVAAGVKQYVFVSVSPNRSDSPLVTAKEKAEHAIVASGMTYTILQPSFFMEIWLGPALGFNFPEAKATLYGEGKNKISWIAIKDVAAFAVAALDNPAAKNKMISLGGPDALSPLEVVSLFEKTANKKFELQHVPAEALTSQKNNAPDDLAKSFASIMLAYAGGDEINMKETLKSIPVKLTSVQEYAKAVTTVS